jgi:GT2 family glycosyltransferase
MNIAVLLTVHDRKSKTLASLSSLFAQSPPGISGNMAVYMVDDGCTDGTPEAVGDKFPQVTILTGTGHLYWAGGMRMAFETAMSHGFDYYLWLNDDTILFPDALVNLLQESAKFNNNVVMVGSTKDPQTGVHTYGGVIRLHRWRPLKFTLVAPKEIPVEVETLNGNCVLVPQVVAQKVGNLDPAFTHAIGDFDYGLRARRLGFGIYLAPGYHGYCPSNLSDDKELSFRSRWKKMFSPHGLPPKEWAVFARRYAGIFWPAFWIFPYLKRLLTRRA